MLLMACDIVGRNEFVQITTLKGGSCPGSNWRFQRLLYSWSHINTFCEAVFSIPQASFWYLFLVPPWVTKISPSVCKCLHTAAWPRERMQKVFSYVVLRLNQFHSSCSSRLCFMTLMLGSRVLSGSVYLLSDWSWVSERYSRIFTS